MKPYHLASLANGVLIGFAANDPLTFVCLIVIAAVGMGVGISIARDTPPSSNEPFNDPLNLGAVDVDPLFHHGSANK